VLFIETYVREDQLRLFGFESALEREWFRLLQSVQGVGAKVALAVLSTLTASELANAIALQDKAMVARAPGIGPKVAQRIVAELKNKAPALGGDAGGAMGLKQELGEGVASAPVADAVSALSNLGYSRDQAANAVAAAMKLAGEDRGFSQADPAGFEGTGAVADSLLLGKILTILKCKDCRSVRTWGWNQRLPPKARQRSRSRFVSI
jgi:Holliday junction DNA helicase RuvA